MVAGAGYVARDGIDRFHLSAIPLWRASIQYTGG
jgi:hypothetical protein